MQSLNALDDGDGTRTENGPAASSAPTRVHIKTHGCQMNEYDSSRMLDLLRESRNAELVDSPEQADILVLNTCSIREKAQEKVFHQLGRWRGLKAAKPGLKIAAFVSCLIRAARKSAGLSTTYLRRRRTWPDKASAKSICWARTSMRIAASLTMGQPRTWLC